MAVEGLLVLVGFSGSGKTTASRILEERGFWRLSSGDTIREMCQAAGRRTDRRALQEFGFELLRTRGHEWYAKLLLDLVGDQRWCVVEGLRSKAAATALCRAVPGSALVFLECEEAIRMARVCLRDGIGADEFREIQAQAIEDEIAYTRPESDFILLNEGGMDALRRRTVWLGRMVQSGLSPHEGGSECGTP